METSCDIAPGVALIFGREACADPLSCCSSVQLYWCLTNVGRIAVKLNVHDGISFVTMILPICGKTLVVCHVTLSSFFFRIIVIVLDQQILSIIIHKNGLKICVQSGRSAHIAKKQYCGRLLVIITEHRHLSQPGSYNDISCRDYFNKHYINSLFYQRLMED